MSRHVLRRLFLVVTFVVAAGWLSGHGPLAVRAQDKQEGTIPLTVSHENGSLPQIVSVELYQDGKLLRTRELNFNDDNRIAWNKLMPGRYEVHFEARGYKKLVKRFTLAEGDKDYKVRVELDKDNSVVVGSGSVSLQEMEKQLETLKKKVETLEAEVEKLKKK
jgi:hypothetical protein